MKPTPELPVEPEPNYERCPARARVAELEALLLDVVDTWRRGDIVGGHEAIGNAERALAKGEVK